MTEQDLIELIYRAALSDDWQSIASALSQMAGSIATHMFGHDMQINKVSLAAHAGYDPDMLALYDHHYHAINAWIAGVAVSEVGKPTPLSDYCAEDVLRGSEFFNEWLRPQEEIGAGGAIVLFNNTKRFIILGGNIRFKDQEKKEKPWLDLLARIGPHLRNAFEFQRMLDGQRLVNRGYLDLIDQMENSIVLLDARGRIEFRNKAAAQLFAAGKVFQTDASGILRLGDIKADEMLKAGVAAISNRQYPACRNAFPIRRADGIPPLLAMLSPFVADHDDTGIFTDFCNDHLPVAVLAIHERAHGQAAERMLATLFGLTAAESALSLSLRAGMTLQHHAAQRSISLHTVRNQLKSVFDKTGTHRQAELVSVLARIVD